MLTPLLLKYTHFPDKQRTTVYFYYNGLFIQTFEYTLLEQKTWPFGQSPISDLCFKIHREMDKFCSEFGDNYLH